MVDETRFEDEPWNDPALDHDALDDPLLDEAEAWESTPSTLEEPVPTWGDPLEYSSPAPPPRIRKRRIVCGALFLVLGLAGVIADAFDTDVGVAFSFAGLIGAVALLAGLIASASRQRQIVQLS